ncbi:MAG: hypothetical protein AUJ74_01555 [Candidatus Omnitrophica bacterium CG1_02_44_16]|nr:MAG: hypothetical protein AUJ74_01555 [Candidatus Omnitrophica bacterium CG1_02_44_16]PIY82013.1 MAG: hypothetical protein COY78_08800 [Candidatus Omnitrophica bacterium CG_4_10_14_0_8_um_filter_44_12]PIZ84626.1 MAG: hypothetical protein COX96_02790 [Candidatus Omnitrophica bacterium CG_4_10_14_0_2_um_filter_44_9]
MIAQVDRDATLRKLIKKREELRYKLRDHFCLPVNQRNYKEFESVVDELDELRKKIHLIKEK